MFNFVPSTIPHNILVIGAGGTGSRLIPLLSQFLRSISRGHSARGWLEDPNVILCDFDTVEEKNLMRQNFIKNDIGKNKAVVLSDRYSKAYGINIVPITTAISSEKDIYDIIASTTNYLTNKSSFPPVIVIMCVDSAAARRAILLNILFLRNARGISPENILIIDSGNENSFGQVNYFNPVVGFPTDIVTPKFITNTVNTSIMPMDIKTYLDMEDNPGMGSCAELDQTLAINALIATNIMAIVQNYYYRKPMNYNRIFIDMNGGSSTTFNTVHYFKNIALKTEEALTHKNLPSIVGGADITNFSGRLYRNHIIHELIGKIFDLEKASLKKAEGERKASEKKKEKDLKLKKEKKPVIIEVAVDVVSTSSSQVIVNTNTDNEGIVESNPVSQVYIQNYISRPSVEAILESMEGITVPPPPLATMSG